MKIKDFKHTPVHFHEHEDYWRFNCALGNGYISKVSNHIFLYGINKHSLYFAHNCDVYSTNIESAKRAVQKQCDLYIQEALGWLEGGVKLKLEDYV